MPAKNSVSANDGVIAMRYLRKYRMIAIHLLLLCQVGCMSDEANRRYETFSPKDVNEVEVLREAPQRPYIVIADFQANNATIKHMRKRAAEVGADAVIVVPAGGSYSRDEVWASSDRHSGSYTRLLATAIKFKTE